MAEIDLSGIDPTLAPQNTTAKKFAEMLMTQNQPAQGQMISGHYVKPSLFQALQPVANMLTGAYLSSKSDEQAQQYADLVRKLGAKEASDILSIAEGKPAIPASTIKPTFPNGKPLRDDETGALMPNIVNQAQPAVVGDSRLALARALTSQTPTGRALIAPLIKQSMPEKPSSVLEFEYAKEHPELVPYLMNKAAAGAARTSLNVQNQLPFKEQIQKEAATGLMKNFETLQNIPSTLQNMDKLVKLSQQPIYAGVGGETKLQTAKFLNNNFGTNIGTDKIGNSEEFKAAAYQGILENLKKTDSNPTLQQQNALKEALGSLGTDPSALPRVVNVMRDVLITKATQHNQLVQQTMQNGVQYPYSIEVPLPKAAPTNEALPNVNYGRLDDILKARGAK